jgi:hypothetical protein
MSLRGEDCSYIHVTKRGGLHHVTKRGGLLIMSLRGDDCSYIHVIKREGLLVLSLREEDYTSCH